MNSKTTSRSSSSGTASQPEPVAVPASKASASAPLLVRPVEGRPAQGSYALFRWIDPSARGASYQLQVAAGEAFDALAIDVAVGATTEVTIMSMLPEDGNRYVWRVGRLAKAGGSVVEWSQPAAFRASTEEAVHNFDEARAKERLKHAAEAAVAIDPWREGQTGGGWAAVVTFVMIVSFIITVSLLFFAAGRIGL